MTTTDVTAEDLATTAEKAARAVAGPLLDAFRSGVGVEHKRDFHDPVTEHDRAAERTISEILHSHHHGSVVVGEEHGRSATGDGPGAVHWYVDPIDGTANFARGLAFFCTSIAAVVGDEVVAGVVYDPVRDDLFTATAAGTRHNGRPVTATGAREDTAAFLLAGFPNPRDLERPGTSADFGRLVTGFATVRRPGSAALSLAHVAAGWADVAFGTGINPWDVAAGALLVWRADGRYLPLGATSETPAWQAPDYLAHVREFDLDGSVLAPVLRSRERDAGAA